MSGRQSQPDAPAEPKRIGRPPGSTLPPELRTKPRSVRLTDEDWQTLTDAGVTKWLVPELRRLRKRIDRARE